MEFIEYKEAEVAVDGVADLAFLQTGQQEFEHHVVGEEDLGRVLLHLGAWSTFFLAGVLAHGYRKGLAGSVFVVLFVQVEFVGLRIDECVHRVDDDCRDAFFFWVR